MSFLPRCFLDLYPFRHFYCQGAVVAWRVGRNEQNRSPRKNI